MPRNMLRWNKADTDRARKMIADGAPEVEFIKAFARTKNAACNRVAYADDPNVRRLTQARSRNGRAGKSDVIAGKVRTKVPDEVLAEAGHRSSLERSLTASFFGDPLPGYSALDRRQKAEACV